MTFQEILKTYNCVYDNKRQGYSYGNFVECVGCEGIYIVSGGYKHHPSCRQYGSKFRFYKKGNRFGQYNNYGK